MSIGAHALTTITDRDEDAAARVRTIAVYLGRRATALFAASWFVVVGLGASLLGYGALALLALPYLGLCLVGRDASGAAGRRLYRLFLVANVAIGAFVTALVLLALPVEAALPAGLLALTGTLLALGVSVGRALLRRR